ncbi:MAG: DUF1538 domain-containing protein [Helicobacteraceae bacterium]|jgi:hypothetical protein|nr:DUF1538 domain-containing protein [Helicobacteraceae bacterium]
MLTFLEILFNAFKNLLPIVAVVAFFQGAIFGGVPENLNLIIAGLLIVVLGVALLLQGLEIAIFPIGKNLSDEFARRGSLPLLLIFGFSLGFAAVIAEPALIAVAEQAAQMSYGRIDPLLLRLIVACSVGLAIMLGVLRLALGHSIAWYVIGGFVAVSLITFFAPQQIVALAYDSGGVTTNVVTVPLIAAFGIGLAASIRGRDTLKDGFGLVAMALLAPIIAVQMYGIVVFDEVAIEAPQFQEDIGEVVEETSSFVLGVLGDIIKMFRDALPIIAVILFFQYAVLRRPLARAHHIAGGFALVILGLYAFVVGLKLGLFPIGTSMANQLVEKGGAFYSYLFAFLLGFAATMAEPALIAVGNQVEEASNGRIKTTVIRLMVALGVAIGITLGTHRIFSGDSLHLYASVSFLLAAALSYFSPRYILALAYDLGGVASSVITVPLVTALGIGLAGNIDGRDVMIDGFGLLVFAAFFPSITVMLYAIIAEWRAKKLEKEER